MGKSTKGKKVTKAARTAPASAPPEGDFPPFVMFDKPAPEAPPAKPRREHPEAAAYRALAKEAEAIKGRGSSLCGDDGYRLEQIRGEMAELASRGAAR